MSSMLRFFFPLQGTLQAAPVKKEVMYNAEAGVIKHPNKTSLKFGKLPTATTTINENAGNGNKIEKIVFYKGSDEVKTIEVNAQTFNQTIPFNGEAIEVVSNENGSNGSWFAWTRGYTTGWTAGGSGETWWHVADLPTSSADYETMSTPVGTKTLLKYPNRKIKMTVKYGRTEPFYGIVGGTKLQFDTTMIDNRSSTIHQKNPTIPSHGYVDVVDDKDVPTGDLDITGRSHYSTEIIEILAGLEPGQSSNSVRSLDFATITFTQEHNADGYKYYTRQSPNDPMREYKDNEKDAQAMIYYYAAYSYTYTSYSYQYPDHYRVYTEETPPKNPESECIISDGRTITSPSAAMQPNASAMIKADQRDREIFDVLQGIPTSESLYGSVLANNYLYKDKFQEKVGVCTYNLTVSQTYHFTWTPKKEAPEPDEENP
ncbi:DUF5704 domain-containing protein, partial [Saccharibacillus sp. CPCC 101409]|uniref:DUF5704 domain-containing protein n=1 Tax=Saccharibacillus sp. CPCC 101409 TaxID=3058041 RepID=UPI002671C634